MFFLGGGWPRPFFGVNRGSFSADHPPLEASDAACRAADFDYELTGVLGIKREHQTQEFAQLVVKAKGKENAKGIEIEEPGRRNLGAGGLASPIVEEVRFK